MITIDNFEGIVPYKILMRGEEYYESGAVSDLKETLPGEWTATVDGTSSYTVEISLEGDKVDSWYFQRIKITERKFKKLSKVLVVVKKLVIIIGIMTLNVTGKLFSQLDTLLEKADFFLKLESLDNTIAIALQTLRSIGENYDDELLYDDDICASDYCEQAGD